MTMTVLPSKTQVTEAKLGCDGSFGVWLFTCLLNITYSCDWVFDISIRCTATIVCLFECIHTNGGLSIILELLLQHVKS